MEKKTVSEFFDRCAPWWDSDMIRNEELIAAILNNGGIREGVHVLDVACGTGVLFPDYLKRGAASVTGIDISPEMAKIASAKFPEVTVLCGAVEETKFDRQFDCVMVYNAFPHFPDPEHLIEVLAGLVKPGGKLSVAHGMSRAALTDHHKRASQVSIDLLHEKELAAIFSRWFDVDVIISTDQMYQVAGVRRGTDTHSHGSLTHSHDHGHDHHHHTEAAPMDETLALMKYMVSHNDAHAQELAELAGQLRESGKDRAYRRLMSAVADFDMANAQLAAVLKELASEAE